MLRVIVVLVLTPALHAQFFGGSSNARSLGGKQPCSSTVTTNCVPNADASGNVAIGTTVSNPTYGVRAPRLLSTGGGLSGDLSDQTTQLIWSDTFADLSKWGTAGTPGNGTITVADSVCTMADTSGAGGLSLSQAVGQAWALELWPFTVEVTMSVPATQLTQALINDSVAANISVVTFASGTVTTAIEGGTPSTVTPTKWTPANKFRLIWAFDPRAKTLAIYLLHKDSDNAAQFVQIKAPTAYTKAYPALMGFATNAATQGSTTIEDIRVYYSWAVVIGDSIAAGHPGYDPVPSYYVSQDQSSSIGYWLEQATGSRRRVLNMGRGGDDTTHVTTRNQSFVLDFKPRLAVYNVGYNDIFGGLAPVESKARLTAIFEATLAASVMPVAVEIIPKTGASAALNAAAADWNTWLATEAVRLNIPLVRVHDRMGDPADSTTLYTPYTTDTIHPNALGYRVMGREVWLALAP